MKHFTHRRLGAQILQAQLSNVGALFYCSPLAERFEGPARGGLPVLFPQFAEYGRLVKHGFARDMDWTLLEHGADDNCERLHYVLEVAQGEYPGWPHAVRLESEALATADAVEFTLTVLNTGPNELSFTGGLHPYFAVDDLLATQVLGLQGLHASDRYHPAFRRQDDPALSFSDAIFERLYDGCPDVELVCGNSRLRLSARGFDQWMVWNPGRDGAQALKDLPNDDWRKFLCVEPVTVARPVRLAPGEKFSGHLRIASA